jgi:hypothetical protein
MPTVNYKAPATDDSDVDDGSDVLSRCLLEEDDSDLSDGDIPLLPQNHGMYQ